MNRLLLSISALLSGLVPLILDSALKGAALLALAAVIAMALFKSSAATRHLVWLVAVVALLVVPVLSVALPQWRILPAWTDAAPIPAPVPNPPRPASEPTDIPDLAITIPRTTDAPFVPLLTNSETPEPVVAPIDVSEANGALADAAFEWLPLAWGLGFTLLVLRLLMAHLRLRRSEHGCTAPDEASINAAFSSACTELGVRQRVTLLLDARRTIPVVWGVLRCRLLLPAEAGRWDEAKLRSVLLHELAHLKRRDPLVLCLSQIACALHWWNPLVWLAAWRMHVERERACDDLVLASGVRPSAYAEHLMEVATQLSPARWTSACGLAMARNSSLEDRLLAVLSEKLNRRRVSAALATTALLLGAGIAIPVAMLRAADEPAAPAEIKPKQEDAQALFSQWQAHARTSGKIPGALIGRLAVEVRYFVSLNEAEPLGREMAAKFEALLPRIAAVGDRTPADAVALLDEIAAISELPLKNALNAAASHVIHPGEPLPAELADAPWGQPAPNGLRVAWLLEPVAKDHPLGTSLKSRILVHNAGKESVAFIMPSWQQSSEHTAQDANATELKVSSTFWTTMARRLTFRLAPGAYCESPAPGIGVGARADGAETGKVRVGAWIEAKTGDEVRLMPGAVEVRCSPSVIGTRIVDGQPENVDPKDAADLWGSIVAERVGREMPIPAGSAEREQILRRLTLDLFGEAPTPEEIAAFVADESPAAQNPLTSGKLLEQRLLHKQGLSPFTGTLPPGEIRFHVLAAEEEGAKAPSVASEPGQYVLGRHQQLQIEKGPHRATIQFDPPAQPYEIALPDNGAYAFAWRKDAGVLFLLTRASLQRVDLTNPGLVRARPLKMSETSQLRDPASDSPWEMELELVWAFDRAVAATAGKWPFPSHLLPGRSAAAGPAGDREAATAAAKVYWGVQIQAEGGDYNPGERFDPEELARLAKVASSAEYPESRRLSHLINRAGAEQATRFRSLLGDPEFEKFRDLSKFVVNANDTVEETAIALALQGYDYSVNGNQAALQSILDYLAKERVGSDAAGVVPLAFIDEWDLTMAAYERHFSSGVDGAAGIAMTMFLATRQCLFPENFDRYQAAKHAAENADQPAAAESPQPRHEDAQTLFQRWQTHARTSGEIPGGMIAELARKVEGFTPEYGEEAARDLAGLRPKIDASRDWTIQEAVGLLDDICSVSTLPVEWLNLDEIFNDWIIQRGNPLPVELKDAAWGPPAENGLRAAWRLDPRTDQYTLGSVLKARVLFHNSGKEHLTFKTETWHQDDPHVARGANGAEIKIKGTSNTGVTPRASFLLAPGEYCEVQGHGIAIGEGDGRTENVGAVIEAKVGDEVRFSSTVDVSDEGWTRPDEPKDPVELWRMRVAERVGREAPLPNEAADRALLIRRAMLDLLGVQPTEEEVAAFTADATPGALDRLVEHILAKPRPEPWTGKLPTGKTKFRVIAAVAMRPKLPDETYQKVGVHCQKFREEDAKHPGRNLMGGVKEAKPADQGDDPLVLGLRVADDADWRIGGEARVELVVRNASRNAVKFSQTPRSDNGLSVVAIDREGVEHHAEIAQFDSLLVMNHLLLPPSHVVMVKPFTIRFDPEKRAVDQPGVAAFVLPPGDYQLRCTWNDARPASAHQGEWTGELTSVKHRFTLAAAARKGAADDPREGARFQPVTEERLKWGEPVDGLRMALAWPPAINEPWLGVEEELYLLVQNVSEAKIRLVANPDAPNPRTLWMREDGKILQGLSDPEPMPGDWLIQPRGVAFFRVFSSDFKTDDGKTTSSVIEASIRVEPRFSMTAEMTIEKANEGAWTGKLTTAETRGSVDVIPPTHKDAQALFNSWTTASRATDGSIPGALIGQLAEGVKTFIKHNPTWETTPQLEKLLPDFDATQDWGAQDAVALLDRLAAVQDSPIKATLEREQQDLIRTGAPLPPELANAPWGEQLANGLRHAWLLEPRAAEHRLGTPLKARVLIHNAGEKPVVFHTLTWHQPRHTATNATGAAINIEATDWLTRGVLVPFRLAPGEFVEVNGPGIGIGPRGDPEDWQQTRVGSWIEAMAGDSVTVTTAPLLLGDPWAKPKLGDESRWWHSYIRSRLARHLPFPAEAEARQRLLYRIAIELFGTPVSKELNDAFAADHTPAALDALAESLFHRPGLHAWAGPVQSGPSNFRVLPADPDAAKKPRPASNPGR